MIYCIALLRLKEISKKVFLKHWALQLGAAKNMPLASIGTKWIYTFSIYRISYCILIKKCFNAWRADHITFKHSITRADVTFFLHLKRVRLTGENDAKEFCSEDI